MLPRRHRLLHRGDRDSACGRSRRGCGQVPEGNPADRCGPGAPWRACRPGVERPAGRGDLMQFDLEHSLGLLGRSPAVLRSPLPRLPEPWSRGTEGPDTFSAFDNVGHLIDGEETDWIPRAKLILARGPSVRFEPYDRFRSEE